MATVAVFNALRSSRCRGWGRSDPGIICVWSARVMARVCRCSQSCRKPVSQPAQADEGQGKGERVEDDLDEEQVVLVVNEKHGAAAVCRVAAVRQVAVRGWL